MSDEIVFYHNPQSRAQMVHMMLEESLLAIDPKGKPPTCVSARPARQRTGG